ncbi:MAG: hypothetical protein K2P51_00440 [Rhabdochlamydiaceae bacterium]|nr:hypothetical protein [Rhabdochlamydiaceae bacterium]
MRLWIFCLLLGGIFSGCAWLFVSATTPPLPDHRHPLLFYSNQSRQDIKLTLCTALNRARTSLYIMMYGITDTEIIALLQKKASQNLSIAIRYDKSASSNLRKLLPQALPYASKGLMHRKMIAIDDTTVFLGTANLTPTSLKHHNNLVIGLHSPPLAQFLRRETGSHFIFEIEERPAELFLLPNEKHNALAQLIAAIDDAQSSIKLAMYTLTHPTIAHALVRAHKRGVFVQVALDLYTARGASRKVVALLEKAQIPLLLSRGQELLHHKWALIDENTLIMGSANWTQAAFAKNEDFLLFLPYLQKNQIKFLNRLWEIIELESF